MASFKSHPLFYSALILAGSQTAGQAWLLFSQRSAASKVSAEIEQKRQTLAAFAYQQPFPSRENLDAVAAERQETEKTLNNIRSLLRSESDIAKRIDSAVAPTTPTDAYFDIANYVERMRAQARSSQVEFAPENRFGFSVHLSTGPERSLIPQVFKQRLYAEYLIGALLSSKNPPKEFISFQREQPLSEEQRAQIAAAEQFGQQAPTFGGGDSGNQTGDYFTIDSRISARKTGSVDTAPFRLNFVGNTAVLRDFLNELALFKVPVVVRSVEVEALAATSAGGTSPVRRNPPPRRNSRFDNFDLESSDAAKIDAVQPIVEQVDSRFTVTLEVVFLVESDEESDDSGTTDQETANTL